MTKKLTEEEFEKHFEDVKYQLELEGFDVTEKTKEVMRKVLVTGELTREQLIEQYKKQSK